MKSLFEAAKSGDMDAVKTAYESLSKLSSSSSSSSASSSDPLSTLLSNLSSAVDSGDISQVQQAIENSKPSGQPPQGGPPPDGQGAGQPPSQESVEAMGEIGEALQSGDLSSAKTAYGSLLKSLGLDEDSSSSSSTASSTSSSSSTADDLSKLLSELGDALDSGSLSAAQSIFSSLTPRGSQGVDTYA